MNSPVGKYKWYELISQLEQNFSRKIYLHNYCSLKNYSVSDWFQFVPLQLWSDTINEKQQCWLWWRLPYMDELAPLTTEDYIPAPPPPRVNRRPVVTHTEVGPTRNEV